MNIRNLLIIGAGSYAVVAYEIARDINCFNKISFVDDIRKNTLNDIPVIGKICDIGIFSEEFTDIIVAIGDADVRLEMIQKVQDETEFNLCTLISPHAYVSTSAKILPGTIIEPMAVVGSLSVVKQGCLICSGAVISHECVCNEGVHIDCGAIVSSYSHIPARTKINSGEVNSRLV